MDELASDLARISDPRSASGSWLASVSSLYKRRRLLLAAAVLGLCAAVFIGYSLVHKEIIDTGKHDIEKRRWHRRRRANQFDAT